MNIPATVTIPTSYLILAAIGIVIVLLALYLDFVWNLLKRIVIAAVVFGIVLAAITYFTSLRTSLINLVLMFVAEEAVFVGVFVWQRRKEGAK